MIFRFAHQRVQHFGPVKISKLSGPIKKIYAYNPPTSLVPIRECPTYFKRSFVVNTYAMLDDDGPAISRSPRCCDSLLLLLLRRRQLRRQKKRSTATDHRFPSRRHASTSEFVAAAAAATNGKFSERRSRPKTAVHELRFVETRNVFRPANHYAYGTLDAIKSPVIAVDRLSRRRRRRRRS